MKKTCNGDCCNLNFDDDNGYKYILDELKRIQSDVNTVIDLLEKRIEKDNIIDDVLSTDYDDDDECTDVKDILDEIKDWCKKNQYDRIHRYYPYDYPYYYSSWWHYPNRTYYTSFNTPKKHQ